MPTIKNYISNSKIIISLSLLTILFSMRIQAQQDDFGWRVSTGYGYTNYYGDLSNYTISWKNAGNIFNLFHLDPKNGNGSSQSNNMLNSYSFSVERKWTNTLGIIVQYSNNTIYGNDKTDLYGNFDPSNLNFSRALNFKSTLNDLSLGVVLRADNNRILRSTSFLAPYLTLTAGYTLFNTKADLYDSEGNPYDYLTDGTISGNIVPDGIYETSLQPLETGDKKYDSNTFNIGLGIGIRLRITSYLGIHAESTLRYTFTDMLDDVGGNYPASYQNPRQEYASNPTGVVSATRGSTNSNDMFVYNSVSLRFSFGAPRKSLYRVPEFNSNSFLISKDQPTTMPIKDTLGLVSDKNQVFSQLHDIKSKVSDNVTVIKENEQIASTEGNHYEIQILKKDSTNSSTQIMIENGMINKIIIENSDAIIKGSYIQNSGLYDLDNDSLKLRTLITSRIPDNNLRRDSTVQLIKDEDLNNQFALENQMDENLNKETRLNKELQTQIDSLQSIILKLRNIDLQDTQMVVTKTSIKSDTLTIQSKIEKLLRAQAEHESIILSLKKKISQDSINKLKKELAQRIEPNMEQNRIIQEDNRALTMRIDSQNRLFNEKVMQLQQQIQNNKIEMDQKTQSYEEALYKIQEVNAMRIRQPELEPELKKEFEKLSIQIQQYETERSITTNIDSAVTFNDKEVIQLKDSIQRLQLEMKLLEEKPAEVINVIVEKPIETVDIESIPVVEIFFELGSAEVKETEESKIAQVAQLLTRYLDSKVILTGMADAIGNQKRNLELSLKRAEAVREILVQKYVLEPTRIQVEAIGSSISEGETAFDRKVKMKLVLSF